MSNIVTAIDFGSSKVACIIAQEGSYDSVDVLGCGMCAYSGLRNGHFEEQELEEAIYSAVREAEIHARRKVREVFASAPHQAVTVMTTKAGVDVLGRNGRISEEDVEDLAAAASELYLPDRYRVLHRSPLYYVIDRQRRVIDPVDLRGRQLDGLFAFSLADSLCLEQVREAMRRLDMKVTRFVSAALSEALMLPDGVRDKTALAVDVGFNTTQVSLIEGDGILYSETLFAGGADITQDLVDGFQITWDEAEQIKRKFAFGVGLRENSRAEISITQQSGRIRRLRMIDVSDIVESRVERILKNISQSAATSGYRVSDRSTLYLSGGGISLMRGVKPFIATCMGRPVQICLPSDPAINTPLYYTAYCILEWAFRVRSGPMRATGFSAFLQWLKSFFA